MHTNRYYIFYCALRYEKIYIMEEDIEWFEFLFIPGGITLGSKASTPLMNPLVVM